MITQIGASTSLTAVMVVTVSLLIPAIAKVAQRAQSATDVFYVMRRHLFISLRGLARQHDVVALVQATWDSFPVKPAPGRERSRDVVVALEKAGFISFWGRTWGGRFVRRTSLFRNME